MEMLRDDAESLDGGYGRDAAAKSRDTPSLGGRDDVSDASPTAKRLREPLPTSRERLRSGLRLGSRLMDSIKGDERGAPEDPATKRRKTENGSLPSFPPHDRPNARASTIASNGDSLKMTFRLGNGAVQNDAQVAAPDIAGSFGTEATSLERLDARHMASDARHVASAGHMPSRNGRGPLRRAAPLEAATRALAPTGVVGGSAGLPNLKAGPDASSSSMRLQLQAPQGGDRKDGQFPLTSALQAFQQMMFWRSKHQSHKLEPFKFSERKPLLDLTLLW
eukprot:scaffold1867_cov247-Pinguiococcus_pyrenoidosus.AAC.32